jgi:purine-nucleoside phosphorylase
MSNSNSASPEMLSYETYKTVYSFILSKLPPILQAPSLGIVLGSGLGSIVDSLDYSKPHLSLDYKDIPLFPRTTVKGHQGRLVFGFLGETVMVIMMGRFHVYEGYAPVNVILY